MIKSAANKAQRQEAIEAMKSGFYGQVVEHDDYGNFALFEAQIADPYDNDTGWECADWYLLDADNNATHLANCDGYSGVEMKIDAEDLAELVGGEELAEEITEAITPHSITGDLIAAARRETKEEADDSYDGECQIWVEYNYYQGTINAPSDGLAMDDERNELFFDDHAEAAEWIDEQECETYYLSHGEAGRPSYMIVKA